MGRAAAAVLLAAAAAARVGALQILLPAHEEECFYEQIEASNKYTGSFEVISGGMQDVDVTVCALLAAADRWSVAAAHPPRP